MNCENKGSVNGIHNEAPESSTQNECKCTWAGKTKHCTQIWILTSRYYPEFNQPGLDSTKPST